MHGGEKKIDGVGTLMTYREMSAPLADEAKRPARIEWDESLVTSEY